MPEKLFHIPLTDWVRGTIDKMNEYEKKDSHSWSQFWYSTYQELGGKSGSSGTKSCPQHAAFGLWQLGRIKDTNIPFKQIPIKLINQEYGKNAAYAEIALDLLKRGQSVPDEKILWPQVQEIFRIKTHEIPAESQQGAIKVARVLFDEGQIVTEQE